MSDQHSDAVLIRAVRHGDAAAYGLLYERSLGAARRAAGSSGEREDLVAEAFTLVLRALRTRSGPVAEFRPYLLVTMRRVWIAAYRRSQATVLCDELPDRLLVGSAPEDPMGRRVLAGVAAEAFERSPARWRTVLWHTEIEGDSPAVLAPRLGLTPNGAAALACRARGLRHAYLAVHLPAQERIACRATRGQLAAWVRRRGAARHPRCRVTAHLNGCFECRVLAAALARINRDLGTAINHASDA